MQPRAQPNEGAPGQACRETRAGCDRAAGPQARPVHRTAQGAAHPHARRQDQPGLAAQAQAGLPPVPVHRPHPRRTVARRPCGHPGRPRRRQVLSGLHPLRPVFQAAGARPHLRHRNARAAGGSFTEAGRRAGLRPHGLPQHVGGRIHACRLHACAIRRGHGPARLRHRHRRCHRLRPGEKGQGHGAGALLPGRGRCLPAPDQGAEPDAHAPGRTVAPSHTHA